MIAMPEEAEPPIQPQNDSSRAAQVEPTEVSRTATIKEISGALTHSGKAYKIIEFEGGEKVRWRLRVGEQIGAAAG